MYVEDEALFLVWTLVEEIEKEERIGVGGDKFSFEHAESEVGIIQKSVGTKSGVKKEAANRPLTSRVTAADALLFSFALLAPLDCTAQWAEWGGMLGVH